MGHESFEANKESKRFKNPQEEIDFLREELSKIEGGPEEGSEERERADIEKIKEYQERPPQEVVEKKYQMSEEDKLSSILGLEPEDHNTKVREVLGIMEEKGIHNALSMVRKMNNFHLEDDLHKTLVQWLKAGYPIKGLKEKTDLWRSLKMTLFEISLPEKENEEENDKSFKELVSSMEQFYAGMYSVAGVSRKEGGFFAFEIATSENNSNIVIYAAVPTEKVAIFEKQLLSVFPTAQIIERKNDYNIFVEEGAEAASVANLKRDPCLPIKGYDEYDHDPLNAILNSFSKIAEKEEGVALQFVFNPGSGDHISRHKGILSELEKGTSLKEAVEKFTWNFQTVLKSIFKEVSSSNKKKEEEPSLPRQPDQVAIEEVKNKMSAVAMPVNIRIVASAKDKDRAEDILDEIESSFNQFENPSGNKMDFKRVKGKVVKEVCKDFIFRRFNKKNAIVLNTKELTSLMHMPSTGIVSSPEFKQSASKTAPAPSDMDPQGIILGVNEHRNQEKEVFLSKEDRLRHFYAIGQTGTGKTNLLKNMITQDIKNGDGVCMIDPHGADLEDILKRIPKERIDDVIYFEPGYTKRAMALNMLEYDSSKPEQKTFVVNELFSIFQKLYSNNPEAMGPMFEQYFRNATMLVLEDPDSGNTLLDISKVLADKNFREHKLSKSKNPVVNQFWNEIAGKAGGESQLENIVPYITSKFDVFSANDIMRPIIAQQKSSFNFKNVMDERKILLVNLAKGKLGDINSHLLGLILVGKILMAALSREGSKNDLVPFYLYIDEFQNVTTDSINTILAEARKYKLSLNVAHQFIAQLNEGIRDSIFGNVGSTASFRVGSEDAEFLANQFEPEFSAKNLMNLYNFNAVGRILVNGYPSKPFNFKTLPPEEGDESQAEDIKQLSYLKYGRSREEIEEEIYSRYQSVL
ncbi:MAG: type IV secretory system conjugative DNA transfer family protein [Patescibacteria group bacterium]